MTKRQAKILWESVLEHNTIKYAIKKLNISEEKAKIFLMYSMPEMFVDNNINILNKKKLKELKEISAKISKKIENKKSSNNILNIGIILYLAIMTPILILTIIVTHF